MDDTWIWWLVLICAAWVALVCAVAATLGRLNARQPDPYGEDADDE